MSDEIEVRKPTSLTADLIGLDDAFVAAQKIRNTITDKLSEAVKSLEFSTDNSKLLEAQMALVNTLLSSLNSTETNAAKRATAKLRNAENETTSKHSATIADLLATLAKSKGSISLGNAQPDTVQNDKARADEIIARINLEPISDKELRTDPSDVS